MQAIHTAKPPCDARHHMGEMGSLKKTSTKWGRGWAGDRVEGTAQLTHQPHSPPEMVGGERYTKYDYETAWRLYREGYKPSEISRILDIPIGTIIHWIKYQASQKKYRDREEKYTLTQYYRALQLYRKGYTVTEIHIILNIPRDPVRKMAKM